MLYYLVVAVVSLLSAFYLFSAKRKDVAKNEEVSKQIVSNEISIENKADAAKSGPKIRGKSSYKNYKAKTASLAAHPLLVKELKGHRDSITSVAFSSDGCFIATASEDETIRIIRVDSVADNNAKHLHIGLNNDYATAIAFSDNNKRLAAIMMQTNKCCLYSIPNDSEIKKGVKPVLVKEFETGHADDVLEVFLMDVEKWMVIITCGKGMDTQLKLFNLKGERVGHFDTGHVKNNVVCASPDNRFLAVGCFIPEVSVIEISRKKTGEFEKVVKAMTLSGHKRQVIGVCFSSDSTRVATLSIDGLWMIWDITVRYNLAEDPRIKASYTLDSSLGTPSGIVFSSNSKIVAISVGKSLQFFSTDTGLMISNIEDACGMGSIIALKALSKCNIIAVIADGNKNVSLWNFPKL